MAGMSVTPGMAGPVAPQQADPAGLPVAVCPYLLDAGESWRASRPMGEHRCTAVSPPVPLATDKQRRLCLVAEHLACQTYQAARALREATTGLALEGASPPRRGVARTRPLVLERGGRAGAAIALAASRGSQLALVGLMAVAVAVLVLARFGGGAPTSLASPTPASSGAESSIPASPSARQPTPSPTAPLTPTPAASPTSTPTPTPTPEPSYRTYTVQSGDTLWEIAVRFGTTVKAIVELNGISDPSRIHAGQVLKIPPP